MRILMSGAGGMLGGALRSGLVAGGHEVVTLARGGAVGAGRIVWDPAAGFDPAQRPGLEGLDAVIHLAGEPIAGLWTRQRRARIRDSRVVGTHNLALALAGLERRPKVFLCASAVGYYGDRGNEVLTEGSAAGSGFLAGVVRDWEAACVPAVTAGIRTVNLRLGAVLGAEGGILARLRLPFSLGLGGRLGSGEQYFPWITLADVVGAIRHLIGREEVSGPVNLCAPEVVTNRGFTAALAAALRRPVGPPAPAWLLRLVLGDLTRELLLASARAVPERLMASGYRHAHPAVEPALRHLLAR